ncbi:MAG: hypothetical protein KatS3mg027_0131 [Bacteroidia bacterium]|nr:MAG: hypothetical protein KatS3mg027_0131 [Bacteroidia bacterium]
MKKYLLAFVCSILFFTQCQNTTNENASNETSSSSQSKQLSTLPLSKEDSTFYAQEGTKLAKQMYAGILEKLRKALDELGYYESVKYCNHHALPLTDSLANYYGIKAKRTSLKLRNPANTPDELEKQVLKMYQQTLSKQPVVYKTKEGIRFFTPIYIAEFCLNCHGKPYENIPDVTLRALNELYPKDEARNYEIYDIRGVWSITFPENYSSILNQITNKN